MLLYRRRRHQYHGFAKLHEAVVDGNCPFGRSYRLQVLTCVLRSRCFRMCRERVSNGAKTVSRAHDAPHRHNHSIFDASPCRRFISHPTEYNRESAYPSTPLEKQVKLEIFSEKENVDQLEWAMESLKVCLGGPVVMKGVA